MLYKYIYKCNNVTDFIALVRAGVRVRVRAQSKINYMG